MKLVNRNMIYETPIQEFSITLSTPPIYWHIQYVDKHNMLRHDINRIDHRNAILRAGQR